MCVRDQLTQSTIVTLYNTIPPPHTNLFQVGVHGRFDPGRGEVPAGLADALGDGEAQGKALEQALHALLRHRLPHTVIFVRKRVAHPAQHLQAAGRSVGGGLIGGVEMMQKSRIYAW